MLLDETRQSVDFMRQYSGDDSTVMSKPKDYCLQFGFNDRTVRRWGQYCYFQNTESLVESRSNKQKRMFRILLI
ncbi:MAG TPA: hypothetical protein EYG49_00430 [Gammaproteobacteria bacterium]|nr:hypothetical protein [Gammaproteobacteria bacterium]